MGEIEVQHGQLWRDKDPRMGGRVLYVRDVDRGYVYCEPMLSMEPRRTAGASAVRRPTRVKLATFGRRFEFVADRGRA